MFPWLFTGISGFPPAREQFWEHDDDPLAASFLDDWIARAHASGVLELKRFADTLQLHKTRLLNYYHQPITTGPLEGTTTKSKPCNAKPTATATKCSST